MNSSPEDDIDALLHKQFKGPIADDGFSDRLMRQLPVRRRRMRWPHWIGMLIGAVACWLSLLSSPLLHLGWRDSVNGQWSTASIAMLLVMLVMAMLALVWAVVEADNG